MKNLFLTSSLALAMITAAHAQVVGEPKAFVDKREVFDQNKAGYLDSQMNGTTFHPVADLDDGEDRSRVDGDVYGHDEFTDAGDRIFVGHNASVSSLLETAKAHKGDSLKLEAIYHQAIAHNKAIRKAGGTPSVSNEAVTKTLRSYGCNPLKCI